MKIKNSDIIEDQLVFGSLESWSDVLDLVVGVVRIVGVQFLLFVSEDTSSTGVSNVSGDCADSIDSSDLDRSRSLKRALKIGFDSIGSN